MNIFNSNIIIEDYDHSEGRDRFIINIYLLIVIENEDYDHFNMKEIGPFVLIIWRQVHTYANSVIFKETLNDQLSFNFVRT